MGIVMNRITLQAGFLSYQATQWHFGLRSNVDNVPFNSCRSTN